MGWNLEDISKGLGNVQDVLQDGITTWNLIENQGQKNAEANTVTNADAGVAGPSVTAQTKEGSENKSLFAGIDATTIALLVVVGLLIWKGR